MLRFTLLIATASASDYVGAVVCGTCHPSQFQSQSATAHAAALARSKQGQPGEWAFGAGSQAITFVSRLSEGEYLEHGESWYRKLNGYAATPGHRQPGGVKHRLFDPSAAIIRCFGCHSTGPVSLAADESIVPNEAGVRCENCHGPGAAHARDPSHSKPFNPAVLNGEGVNDVCGSCHRMPGSAGAATDLRDPWNSRHQPLLLAASACFRKSGGRLSCFTCHAPHAPLVRELASYDTKCGGCHASPRHAKPVKDRPCAECHMPAVKPSGSLSFANHRIAVYRPADPLTPVVHLPAGRR